MASPQPPNDPPPSGSGIGGGPSPAKAAAAEGSSQAGGQAQQLIDLFGVDMGTASMTLVLLLLGLIRASFDRCTC
jgi:hypothetical protein